MLDCSVVEIVCACGHNPHLNQEEQIKKLKFVITVANLNEAYEKFKCDKCGAKHPKAYDKNKNLLFDPKNLTRCQKCKKFVSMPRIQAERQGVDVKYCSAKCQHDNPITEQEIAKGTEHLLKAEETAKKIKGELVEKRMQLRTNLLKKKGTMISALNAFKQGSIDKKEYERKFKQFTWWIKEEVEGAGGYIIDNPASYVNCPKCSNLTLVLWTPKFNRYFLGCSEYRNGCKWAKTIWVHDA